MPRIPITKTPKCYVGGAFIRSESNLTYPISDANGQFFANIPLCTRKDVRNATEAAAKAHPSWANRSAYNRGQILYRIAEMLEARSSELIDAHFPTDRKKTATELTATIDRIIHYAGWTDKFQALLGSTNPVSSPHFNFSIPEPMGIIAIVAPDEAPLLALLSMILPAITSGNTTIALASHTHPYPAILLGEILATSDLPPGTINILTGKKSDILPTLASHQHIRAIYAHANQTERTAIQQAAADSLKRTTLIPSENPHNWLSNNSQGLHLIHPFTELKTTWHPIG